MTRTEGHRAKQQSTNQHYTPGVQNNTWQKTVPGGQEHMKDNKNTKCGHDKYEQTTPGGQEEEETPRPGGHESIQNKQRVQTSMTGQD